MGKYITRYINDFLKGFQQVEIEVYLIIDDVRQSSSYEFETPYLPTVWRNWCLTPEKMVSVGQGGKCSIPYNRIRSALLTLTEGMTLVVPVPWPGNRSEFRQFFQDLARNSGIRYIAMDGERLNPFYTERFVC